jgi:hypothetical protein
MVVAWFDSGHAFAVHKRRVLMVKKAETEPSAGTDDVEFVEDVPPKAGGGTWVNRLLPLLSKPNVWARIWVYENPDPAYKLQSNLQSRQVKIPEPEHVWDFAARGCEVYAVYRGRNRSSGRVRRAN